MTREDVFVCLWLIGVFGLLVVCAFFPFEADRACEIAGGQMIRTHHGDICAKVQTLDIDK